MLWDLVSALMQIASSMYSPVKGRCPKGRGAFVFCSFLILLKKLREIFVFVILNLIQDLHYFLIKSARKFAKAKKKNNASIGKSFTFNYKIYDY